jgi:nitrite reductase/ring-hydroxylating ferredoxin subunit
MVGEKLYAICNVEGRITALDGVCPHHGGPLGQGQIHGGHLVCPYHMWEFDCRTGEYDRHSALRVATYQVKVEDGEILLQVP